MHEKTCEHCLKTYQTNDSQQQFCGKSCATSHRWAGRFNADFWNEDTPTTAYWAGFVMADGHVTDEGRLSITLHPQDRPHLQMFLDALEADEICSISEKPCNGTLFPRVSLSSRAMSSGLSSWGLCTRKTYDVRPSQKWDIHPQSFLRGLWDGDGSIYRTNRDGRWSAQIVGNSVLTSWVSDTLESLDIPTTSYTRYRRGGFAVNSLRVDRAGVLASFIEHIGYLDNDLPALARKRDRAREAHTWATNR